MERRFGVLGTRLRKAKSIILVITAVLFLSVNISVYGQSHNISFKYLNTDHGLSQSDIICMYKDSQGYMWFGTRDGLNRYDGYSFKVYRHDRNDSSSVCSSHISTIAEDKNGNLWIGTTNGVCMYNPTDDRFINYTSFFASKGAVFTTVHKLLYTDGKYLWLCTNESGLVQYNLEDQTVEVYKMDPRTPNSLNDNNVEYILKTRSGKYYVATGKEGFFRFDPTTKSMIQQYRSEWFENTTRTFVKVLFEDSDDKIWIGSYGSRLACFDPFSNTVEFFNLAPNGEGLNNNFVKGFVEPVPGQIWICAEGGGINIYNKQSGRFSYIVQDISREGSLSNNSVVNILVDERGLIWIGTYYGGINIYDPFTQRFATYKNNPDVNTTISENPVLSIFEDSKGRIWVGTDGGGLNLFHKESGTFSHFRKVQGSSNTMSTNVVTAIGEDAAGNILLGTWAGGMMQFSVEQNRWYIYRSDENNINSLSVDHVFCIKKDAKGNLWLGLINDWMDQYIPSENRFVHYGPKSELAIKPSGHVFCIVFDKKNKLWLGTDNGGVWHLDPDTDELTNLPYNQDTNSLSHQGVSALYMDTKGILWVGTEGGGLNSYDPASKQFNAYTTNDGLPSNVVRGILEDRKGNLWLSTTRGLSKFDPKNVEFTNYDVKDGLQGNEYKFNASLKDREGYLYFGGLQGLNVFHPDSIKTNMVPPLLLFTDLRLYTNQVLIGAKGSPLKKHINYTKKIRLNHRQAASFTIEYVALNYTSPEKNLYAYMMEGYDKDWSYVGGERKATYTNLNAGKYIFRIKACNNDGIWNEAGRSIQIIIRPPWWRTWWFLTLCVMVLVYLVYVYIRFREKQALHDRMILEEKISSGEAQIKEKIAELEKQKEEIRLRDIQEHDMHYINEGLVKFGIIISKKRSNLEKLCQDVLDNVINYVGVNQGAIFIVNDSNPPQLELKASYALDGERHKHPVFELGEGLIGSAFATGEDIIVDNLPDTYTQIGSGLGNATPKHIAIVPLKQEVIKEGIIELITFKKLEAYKVNFIKRLGENLASIIAMEKAIVKSNQMLNIANEQSEEMKAQGEELRQNLEEMMATQEDLRRQSERLGEIIKEKETLEKEVHILKTQLAKMKEQ